MLFKTAGRRVEIDVHMPGLFRLNLVGTFIRFPLLGEVFREYGYWIHTPWKEVKAIEALWQARRAEWEREASREEAGLGKRLHAAGGNLKDHGPLTRGPMLGQKTTGCRAFVDFNGFGTP